MEPTSNALRLFPFLAASIALVGCGGGGTHTAVAKAKVAALHLTVDWPAAARASNEVKSVEVSVEENGAEVAHVVLNRPALDTENQTEYTFENLPAGDLTTSATGYAQADAGGDPLGAAQTTCSLKAGQTLMEDAAISTSGSAPQLTTTGTQSGTGSLAVGVH